MYQVLFDNIPIYDPRDEELVLLDPVVHLAVGEAGAMSFTIEPNHPQSSRLTRTKGVVELRADGQPIFKGRIRKDTRGFYKSRDIEVEGLLACLNDSLIPPFAFPGDFLEDADYQAAAASGNVVAFFLGWLLAQHNAQTGPEQQIQLGDVTVVDPNNYISRSSSSYLPTMEAVRKKLEETMGGYLLADYSGEVTKLHYYADLPLINIQEVDFGRNLLDLTSELDNANTYTAILPIGSEGLTIEALPDGEIVAGIWKQGRLIYSKEAEDAIGGRITHFEEWPDVTVATNLRRKAVELLTGEGVKTVQTITVRAADLGAVEDLPRFIVGRYVRLNSAPHGFADLYPLMELQPDILDPANTEIVMGATVKAATDIAHANLLANQEQQDQLRTNIQQQREKVDSLTSSVQTQITQVIQTCEELILSATGTLVETSDFDTYKETVEAALSILEDQILLKFTETMESVTNVDGDLQRTVETLSKHFEFELDGLTIKAGEQSMSLKLDNGLISFQKNAQQFGWWDGVDFHTGNIIIDVNERAQFGNFAAIPRSNGGLSWLKVKG